MDDDAFRARLKKALGLDVDDPEAMAKKIERLSHERSVMVYMIRRAAREMPRRLGVDLVAELEDLLAGK